MCHRNLRGIGLTRFHAIGLILSTLLLSLPELSIAQTALRVGVYHNPPKLLQEGNRLSGILGDLLTNIAEREHWTLTQVPCVWNDCLMLLETGEIDLMPYVALSDETLLPVEALEAGFEMVKSGDADLVASNHFFGDAFALQRDLLPAPVIFQPSRVFFAASSGTPPEILATIDTYLQRWQQDPQSPYFEILARWSVAPPSRVTPIIEWALSALAAALLLSAAFGTLLRVQVSRRTASLRESEERLNTILDSIDACIYIKDKRSRYTYVNSRVAELVGLPVNQIIGSGDETLFGTTRQDMLDNEQKVLRDGARIVEEEHLQLGDGSGRTFLSVKLPLRDSKGRIYSLCGISTDITEHREIQNRLHQLAFYDPLTRLPNRRLILERLEHALASQAETQHQGALLVIDLDNFKTLNDTLGHEAGDEMLQQVAGRLSAGLRATDTAGRLGADEFVIIVEDLGHDHQKSLMHISEIANQLLTQLSLPYDLNGSRHVSSASIGVALFSDTQGSVNNLLKGADLALAAAKNAGRCTLRFFNPAMQTEVNRRTAIESALRLAIESDQIRLHVQPQLNSDAQIIGMEVLARWEDAVLGHVSPAEFISVAEITGLIIPLGEKILDSAINILKEWQHHPSMADLSLAVNISPEQFRHPTFVGHLADLIRTRGINPGKLELEITESLLIEDMENTAARMDELREMGIRFSLDDFGTGYASLGYLKRLPLHQLKIDQSFVRDLLTDPDDEAIIRTILALGKSLDLRVIAEGVETEGQVERLRELGCDVFQGYYFGRPEPVHTWQKRLLN
jgi:diguanylate cyclase (GGDEF)-like protein/PAS domain S-box-containing protein